MLGTLSPKTTGAVVLDAADNPIARRVGTRSDSHVQDDEEFESPSDGDSEERLKTVTTKANMLSRMMMSLLYRKNSQVRGTIKSAAKVLFNMAVDEGETDDGRDSCLV